MRCIRSLFSFLLVLTLINPIPIKTETKELSFLAPKSINLVGVAYASFKQLVQQKLSPDQILAELEDRFKNYPEYEALVPVLKYWVVEQRGFALPSDLDGLVYDEEEYTRRLGEPGLYPFSRSRNAEGLRRGLQVRKYWSVATPEGTNEIFHEVIAKKGSPSMAFDIPTQIGLDPDEGDPSDVGNAGVSMFRLKDYEDAFDGIDQTAVNSNFTINGTAMYVVAAYEALARKRAKEMSLDDLRAKAKKILQAEARRHKKRKRTKQEEAALARAATFDSMEESELRKEALVVMKSAIRGTIQNDVYKEYVARNNFVFPLRGTNRLFADFMEHAQKELPVFRLVSVCGYHMREKESTPAQEVAYAINDALQYIAITMEQKKDLDPNEFVSLFSFFFNTKLAGFLEGEDEKKTNLTLLTESAKVRAGRRIWAKLMKEGLGLTESKALNFAVMNYSGGTEATKSKMELTTGRLALQSLASLLGTPQGTNSYSADEAIDIPVPFYGRMSLLTDYITILERGITDQVDPAGGSYYFESLTDQIEAEIWTILKSFAQKKDFREVLTQMRNDTNRISQEMENAFQAPSTDPKHLPKVGRNVSTEGKDLYPTQEAIDLPASEAIKEEERTAAKEEKYKPPRLSDEERRRVAQLPESIRDRIYGINETLRQSGLKPDIRRRLVDLRTHLMTRDNEIVFGYIERLKVAAQSGETNLMDLTVEAIEAGLTVGEWKKALTEIFGESATGFDRVTSVGAGPWQPQNPDDLSRDQSVPVYSETIKEFILAQDGVESSLKEGLEKNFFDETNSDLVQADALEAPGQYPYTRGTSDSEYKLNAVVSRQWTSTVQDPLTSTLLSRPTSQSEKDIIDAILTGKKLEINLDGWALAEEGADAKWEMALLIRNAHSLIETIVSELKEKSNIDIQPETLLESISVTVSIGDDALTEVAKIRALRQLWAQWFSEAYGLSQEHKGLKLKINARTAAYVLSKEQSWVNEARIAQQVMLAAWGGVDSVEALPFDYLFRDETFDTNWSDWADRMAWDTVKVVALEAGGNGLRDPLGGSFSLESKTKAVAAQTRALLDELSSYSSQSEFLNHTRKALARQKRGRDSQKRVGDILDDPRYPDVTEEEQYYPEKKKRFNRTRVTDEIVPAISTREWVQPKQEPVHVFSFLEGETPAWQTDLIRETLKEKGFSFNDEDVNRWVDAVKESVKYELGVGEERTLFGQGGKRRLIGNFRIALGKVGGDGHDRGLNQVAVWLSDAGATVDYLGLRVDVENVGRSAIDNDVRIVAISSATALSYVQQLWDYWDNFDGKGVPRYPIVVGGAIPPKEAAKLRALGVPVFGPESSQADIVMGMQRLLFRSTFMSILNSVATLDNRPTVQTKVEPTFHSSFQPLADHEYLYWTPSLLNEISAYYFSDVGQNEERLKKIQELAFRGGITFQDKKDLFGGFQLVWPNGYHVLFSYSDTGTYHPAMLGYLGDLNDHLSLEQIDENPANVLGLVVARDISLIKEQMKQFFFNNPERFFAEPLIAELPKRFIEIKTRYFALLKEVTAAFQNAIAPFNKQPLVYPAALERATQKILEKPDFVDERLSLFEEAFQMLDERYMNLRVRDRWDIGRTKLPETRISPRQMILKSGLFDTEKMVELADSKKGPVKRVDTTVLDVFLKRHKIPASPKDISDSLDSKDPTKEKENIKRRTIMQQREAARLFIAYGLNDDQKVIDSIKSILGLGRREDLIGGTEKKFKLKTKAETIQVLVALFEANNFDDETIFTALTRFKGSEGDRDDSVLVVAFEKGFEKEIRAKTNGSGYVRPRGMWKMIRSIRLAEMLRVPILFLNDATGAWVGVEADLDDQGQAISRLTSVNLSKNVPGVSVITGEAGSAPILATSVDPIWMLQYAFRNTSNPLSAFIFENIKDRVVAYFFGGKIDGEKINPLSLEDLPNVKEKDLDLLRRKALSDITELLKLKLNKKLKTEGQALGEEAFDAEIKRQLTLPETVKEIEHKTRLYLYMDFEELVVYEVADGVAGLPHEALDNGTIQGIIPEPLFGGLRGEAQFYKGFGHWFAKWLDEQQGRTLQEIMAERRQVLRSKTPRYSLHPNPPERKEVIGKRLGKRSIESTLMALTNREGFITELNAGFMPRKSSFYDRIPSLKLLPEKALGSLLNKLPNAIEETGNLTGVATGLAKIAITETVIDLPEGMTVQDVDTERLDQYQKEKTVQSEEVMLILRDPIYLAGSKAGVEGEKISLAMEAVVRHYDQTGERIPVVMYTTGGGARSSDQIWGMEELAKNNEAILQLQKRGIPVIDVNAVWVFGGDAASTHPASTVMIAEKHTYKRRNRGSGEMEVATHVPLNGFVGPKISDTLEHVPRPLKETPFRAETFRLDATVDREKMPAYLVKLIQAFRNKEKETDNPERLMQLGINEKRWETILNRGKSPFAPTSKGSLQNFSMQEGDRLMLLAEGRAGMLRRLVERDRTVLARLNLGDGQGGNGLKDKSALQMIAVGAQAVIDWLRESDRLTPDRELLLQALVNGEEEVLHQIYKNSKTIVGLLNEALALVSEQMDAEINVDYRTQKSKASKKRYEEHFARGTIGRLQGRRLPEKARLFKPSFNFDLESHLLVERASEKLNQEVFEEQKNQLQADEVLIETEWNELAHAKGIQNLRRIIRKNLDGISEGKLGRLIHFLDAGPGPNVLAAWGGELADFNTVATQENMARLANVVEEARLLLFEEIERIYDEFGYDVKIESRSALSETKRRQIHDRLVQKKTVNVLTQNPDFGVSFSYDASIERGLVREIANAFVLVVTKRKEIIIPADVAAASESKVGSSI